MQYLDPVPVSTCLGDGAGNDFRLTEQYMNCLEGKMIDTILFSFPL